MQLRKIQLAGIRTLTADCCSALPAIELASSIPYIIVHTEIVGFAM